MKLILEAFDKYACYTAVWGRRGKFSLSKLKTRLNNRPEDHLYLGLAHSEKKGTGFYSFGGRDNFSIKTFKIIVTKNGMSASNKNISLTKPAAIKTLRIKHKKSLLNAVYRAQHTADLVKKTYEAYLNELKNNE